MKYKLSLYVYIMVLQCKLQNNVNYIKFELYTYLIIIYYTDDTYTTYIILL